MREYVANSTLAEKIQYSDCTARVMTTTKAYDNVTRLLSIASVNTTPVILCSNAYAYGPWIAVSSELKVRDSAGNIVASLVNVSP